MYRIYWTLSILLCASLVQATPWLLVQDTSLPNSKIYGMRTECYRASDGWNYIELTDTTATVMRACLEPDCTSYCRKGETYKFGTNNGTTVTLYTGEQSDLVKKWTSNGYGVEIGYQVNQRWIACNNATDLVATPTEVCLKEYREMELYQYVHCRDSNEKNYVIQRFSDPACSKPLADQVWKSGVCDLNGPVMFLCPSLP